VPSHLLVTNDYPPKVGGIQVYLHELWRRLPAGRAVVLTASSDANAQAFDSATDVVIERVPQSLLFFPTWRVLRQIRDAVERHNPDLVLLDPAWPLGLLGPFLGRPFGVILHGAEVTIPGRIPVLSSTLRFVLRRAHVAVSAGTYPEAEAIRNAKRPLAAMVQVPPGVDVERFHPVTRDERSATRRELQVADETFLIASYSRLVPRKGMDVLIRAAAMLRNEIPELVVTIGGSGRDRARLERLAGQLGAPVTFLGRVSDEMLPQWLAASDVMVMVCRSRWLGLEQEGFGIVFAEASACGVPVIAGRSGGSHDAVLHGETGLIVDDPHNVAAVADAIRELFRDPQRRHEMGLAGREHATASFDWSILARQLDNGLRAVGG
jgi:phosphatidylinositol alpha-1,6-mannosyltransferase